MATRDSGHTESEDHVVNLNFSQRSTCSSWLEAELTLSEYEKKTNSKQRTDAFSARVSDSNSAFPSSPDNTGEQIYAIISLLGL
jgi:hypothetical protein